MFSAFLLHPGPSFSSLLRLLLRSSFLCLSLLSSRLSATCSLVIGVSLSLFVSFAQCCGAGRCYAFCCMTLMLSSLVRSGLPANCFTFAIHAWLWLSRCLLSTCAEFSAGWANWIPSSDSSAFTPIHDRVCLAALRYGLATSVDTCSSLL